MRRARPEAERPTVEQLRNLIGRTETHVLSGDEAARLRAGFEHLIASQAGLTAQVARLTRQLAAGSRPALEVDCPTCRAPVDSPCVNRYGQPTAAPHTQRLASAALPADDRNRS
ncbi:zinc finger domain-containing protein [Streptomyces sp. NPDC001340]